MLKRCPFIRIFFAFSAGIFLSDKILGTGVQYENLFYFLLAVSFLGFLVIVSLRFYSQKLTDNALVGAFLLVFLFLLGLTRAELEKYSHQFAAKEHFDNCIFVPLERPRETENFWKFTAKIQYSEKNKAAVGKQIFLYIPKDSISAKAIHFKTLIYAATRLNPIEKSKSEHDFDFYTLAARKGIYYQCFLREKTFVLREADAPDNYFWYYSDMIRTASDEILRKRIDDENAYAVATAMFLGIKDQLSEDIQRHYSVSGAMHVLAVSGLHVGVLLALLSFVLEKIFRRRKESRTFLMIILTSVWFYALLTGFSASVVRATVMFSFVIIGKYAGKKVSNFNLLASSAFFMLLFEPLWLFDVGFLLSYSAVLGIFYYQPLIYQFFEFENRFADEVWSLISVSLAAQISTLPLTFYYFHQFPTYFLLTNLIVIALSAFGLKSIAALLIFHFVPVLGDWIAVAAKYLLLAMNYVTEFIESLPDSAYSDIFLTEGEAWLMTFNILALTFFAAYKKLYHLRFAVIGFAALLLFSFAKDYEQADKHELIIFGGKKTALMFRKGHQGKIVSELSREKLKKFQLGHFAAMRIKSTENANGKIPFAVFPYGKIYVYGGKKIVLLEKIPDKYFEDDCDVLIVTKNSLYKSKIPEKLNTKLLVLDGSNIYYFSSKVETYAAARGIKVHNTRKNGNCIISFDPI
jgi:competence protein ComEC